MKKSSLLSLVSYINGEAVDNIAEIKAEIEAELSKGAEAKAVNDAIYAEAKATVMAVLDKLTAPATLAEIYTEAEDLLPEGFTKGKFQYAMTRLWADDVVKTEGKPNTYSKA